MLAIICRASLTVVSKVIVSIIFASLKCRLIMLPKIILKNQSVNITFDRVGSLCLASFGACELNPYSAAEESHQLSICASSTALLFIFSFMFSAVESIFRERYRLFYQLPISRKIHFQLFLHARNNHLNLPEWYVEDLSKDSHFLSPLNANEGRYYSMISR